MPPALKTAAFARAALLGIFSLALGMPACSEDQPSLGTCETPNAGSGGSSGGSDGRGGSSGSAMTAAGETSDAGDGSIGGMPDDDGGRGGKGGNGGMGGTGGAGGKGGGSGAGGTGGANGGSGGTGGGGGSGGGKMLQICEACEDKCNTLNGDPNIGTEICLHGPGVAQAGPAKGAPLSELCAELLDCMLRTNCGAEEPQFCYCTNAVTCQTSGADGPCVDEVEAASESAEFNIISMRINDPLNYAAGRAFLTSECYRTECPGVCYH